jgi:hypothetical protein
MQEEEKLKWRRLSVEDLETTATMKKELTYDPSLYAEKFQKRDESYLPCDRTLNQPNNVLMRFERIDYLWSKLKSHAWEVGKKQVFIKNVL